MGRRHGRCTYTSCQLSSSPQIVLNDDDLLTLILLRVPWKTLMSLKCVSRQWLSLITGAHFIRLRSLHPFPASGFFFQATELEGIYDKVYCVHLDGPNTPSPFRSLTFAQDPSHPARICILQSCNGLLLCCTDPSAPVGIQNHNFYVYNPSTNTLDTLPNHPCHKRYGRPRIDLIFDPSKTLHYKVISFLNRPESHVGDFYIYSSETGTWRPSIKSYLPSPDMWIRDGVYWNGCVHWLSEYSDSQPVSDSLYFDVDKERLQTFPSPPITAWSRRNFYFGESEGHLHYTEVCPEDSSFSVYEMKNDYSEWFVKYQIDLVPISKAFPEMNCTFSTAVASLVRRKNFKEDSFLILEVPGKIIRYNLVDRSFNVIWNFAEDLELQDDIGHRVCGIFKAWPYIE